jgi:hypothetical protein
MLASIFVLAVFALLVIGLIAWVIMSEVRERRKARAAARAFARYQRSPTHKGDISW